MIKHHSWVADFSQCTDDVAYVKCVTSRDSTSVIYEVRVGLRKLLASAYEEGEGEVGVWHATVEFGQTDATVAGGAAFVEAARRQQEVAAEAWERSLASPPKEDA